MASLLLYTNRKNSGPTLTFTDRPKNKLVKGKPLARVGRKATGSPKLHAEVDSRAVGRGGYPHGCISRGN
jgi:hypothetical protein